MSSKLDQMRAFREAKYARLTSPAATRVPRPAKQTPVTPPPANPPVPSVPPAPPAAPQTDQIPPTTPAPAPRAEPAPSAAPAPSDGHGVKPGKPVHLYKPQDLIAVVQWVTRDGKPRTSDEIIEACMQELQFVRKGRKIVAAFSDAIAASGAQVVDSAAA